jgi:hypothetical protein
MPRLLLALRTAIALARADVSESERYDMFALAFRSDRIGQAVAESDVRSAYLQWRLTTLRANADRAMLLQAVWFLVNNRRRQLIIASLILVTLALVFPPFQLTTADQSVHLGFGFVFFRQVGQINAALLLVELGAIGVAYWLTDRFLSQARSSVGEASASK